MVSGYFDKREISVRTARCSNLECRWGAVCVLIPDRPNTNLRTVVLDFVAEPIGPRETEPCPLPTRRTPCARWGRDCGLGHDSRRSWRSEASSRRRCGRDILQIDHDGFDHCDGSSGPELELRQAQIVAKRIDDQRASRIGDIDFGRDPSPVVVKRVLRTLVRSGRRANATIWNISIVGKPHFEKNASWKWSCERLVDRGHERR